MTSLLLLPSLFYPTPTTFRSSYKSTFQSLLPKLIPKDHHTTTRLDIALVLSPTYPPPNTPSRSTLFASTQTLLRQTYSLITAVAASSPEKIDLDIPGGIDVRIFIVDLRTDQISRSLVGKQPLAGPIIDIDTVVLSDRIYSTVYSPDGEDGERHLKAYLTTWGTHRKDGPPPVVRVPAGPSMIKPGTTSLPPTISASSHSDQKHLSVAVGGTFDHLHIGHKLLLTATVLASTPSTTTRKITIGITGDALLVNKKYGSHVESWDLRQQRTAEFVDSVLAFYPSKSSPNAVTSGLRETEYIDNPGPNGKIVRVTYRPLSTSSVDSEIIVNYTLINDPFGPTITEEDISALVISAETRAGGKAVNDKRAEKGWKELEVFEVDVLDAGDGLDEDGGEGKQKETFESKISSTEIRRRLQARETKGSL
jgi:phosphopantetheine adenylyltransferase